MEFPRIFYRGEHVCIVYPDGVVIAAPHYGASSRFRVSDPLEFIGWLESDNWYERERGE